METTTNSALNNIHLKEIQDSLARDNIKMSAEELLDIIVDFSLKNKQKLIETIRNRGKQSDNLLKEWLATPVDTERTDALSEHDLVM
jgi:hypothetical protein